MMPFSSRRTFIKTAIGSIAGMSFSRLASGNAFAQAGAARIMTIRLADNLFLLSGAGANVVAMTGSDGVVMVDGGLAEHSADLLQAVSALAPGPGRGRVHTLFNTCWFPEQTGSNLILGKAAAMIIAHENTRLWMTTDITRPCENRTFQPVPREALSSKTFFTTGSMTAVLECMKYGYMMRVKPAGYIYVFVPMTYSR